MPRESGWGSPAAPRHFFHGGERYRYLAEAALFPCGTVDVLEWGEDEPIEAKRRRWIRARRCRRPRRLAVAEHRGGVALRRGAPSTSIASQGDGGDVRLPARVDRPRRGRPSRGHLSSIRQDDDLDGGRVRGGDHPRAAARHPCRDRCRPDRRLARFRADGAAVHVFRDLADCPWSAWRAAGASTGTTGGSLSRTGARCASSARSWGRRRRLADSFTRADSLVDLASGSDIPGRGDPHRPDHAGSHRCERDRRSRAGLALRPAERHGGRGAGGPLARVRGGELRVALGVYDWEPPPERRLVPE